MDPTFGSLGAFNIGRWLLVQLCAAHLGHLYFPIINHIPHLFATLLINSSTTLWVIMCFNINHWLFSAAVRCPPGVTSTSQLSITFPHLFVTLLIYSSTALSCLNGWTPTLGHYVLNIGHWLFSAAMRCPPGVTSSSYLSITFPHSCL